MTGQDFYTFLQWKKCHQFRLDQTPIRAFGSEHSDVLSCLPSLAVIKALFPLSSTSTKR